MPFPAGAEQKLNIPSLPSINQVANWAEIGQTIVQDYFVSTIQNLGLGGIEFHVKEDEEINLTAEITDHYTESNTTINDNIAIKPFTYTVSGRFAEKVFNINAKPKSTIQKLTEKVSVIAAFVPVVTGAMRSVQSRFSSASDIASYAKAGLGSGIDIYQAYKTLNPPDTEQAKAYNFIRSLFMAKQTIAFDSPWGFMANFAIENVTFTQPAETNGYSFVRVKLKQVRIARTVLEKSDPAKRQQGKARNQITAFTNQGKVQTKKQEGSFLFQKFGKVF